MNVYIACPCGFVTSAMAAKLFAQACSGRLVCEVAHGTGRDIPDDVKLVIYQDGTNRPSHPTAYVRPVRNMLSLEEYRQIVEEWVKRYEA
ncbi:hypothetical protein [Exiguobacterium aurantiacum]|uniref:Phosphotransferase system EIIB component type 2/3 domain-containing protein n=1 Tax=Exiguobacterium aurantiacum TaxID=33987 RepID=A0A377FWL8_9BACL|nr:hypothetical protein [Exiguobacterium aurantiacum]STO09207.1 Uncharacterised protein [Exiguobacterium aurantiacum]